MPRIRFRLLLIGFAFLSSYAHAQKGAPKKAPVAASPKLIVGIVVDQMRPDYLERFRNRFVKGGFKRLLREGFNCEQANYSYVPTFTAPGHACIYTGTPPSVNGIIANDWFDRVLKTEVY